MMDFSRPPPRGSFDYLLEGVPPKPRPPPAPPPEPIQAPPPVGSGGRWRIHIIIELPRPQEAAPRPQIGIWPLLFWFVLTLLFWAALALVLFGTT
jgi:hypothetical protein